MQHLQPAVPYTACRTTGTAALMDRLLRAAALGDEDKDGALCDMCGSVGLKSAAFSCGEVFR